MDDKVGQTNDWSAAISEPIRNLIKQPVSSAEPSAPIPSETAATIQSGSDHVRLNLLPVPVKVISEHGAAALVEWLADGKRQRSFYPKDRLEKNGGTTLAVCPEEGAPYGAAWAAALANFGLPDSLAQAAEENLHRRGIWTGADLQRRRPQAVSALQQTLGLTISALLQIASDSAAEVMDAPASVRQIGHKSRPKRKDKSHV